MNRLIGLLSLICLSAWSQATISMARGEPPALFPAGYLDYAALSASLRTLAADHADVVKLSSIAKSLQGRDVWLIALDRPNPEKPKKPAILIAADLEGDLLIGSEVALRLARRLASGDEASKAILSQAAVYIVPRLNPDAAERCFGSPNVMARGNARRLDRDRDGRDAEDGPEDINGDGVIASIRVKDADKGTLVADSADARILRAADPAKNERGVYRELSEGTDNDGDGEINEDPIDGVHLGRNWPHGWTEFDPETGFAATSEPETRGLIQFAFDHPEIAAVWCFGLQDNLRAEAKKPDDADARLFAELSKEFVKASELPAPAQPNAPAPAPAKSDAPKAGVDAKSEPPKLKPCGDGPVWGAPADGSLAEWAYHQFGAVGLATRLWTSPRIPAPSDPAAKIPDHGDARWLFWSDKVMEGRAFVAWTEFAHPKLGKVEIGGWRPGVRLNPPTGDVDAIADVQWTFLQQVAKRMPSIRFAEVKVEPQGSRLFKIEATVENVGQWPTDLAQGVKIRQGLPVLVRPELGKHRLLAGAPLSRIDRLEGSGGRKTLRWLVQAADDSSPLTIKVSHPRAGQDSKTLTLKAAK